MLQALSRRGWDTRVIDLATLQADALLARAESAEVAEAIAETGNARIVIAATPTYRALYTGLLKAFFDLMPQGHLRGKLCVGIQTGIAREHYLSPEYGLRPLFASLDGMPATVLYATDDQFAEGQPLRELIERVEALAEDVMRIADG
jgi:FMN reductase